MIGLTLPFPPSANAYIRHAGHRHYFSKEANAFREAVAEIVAEQKIKAPPGRLMVTIRLFAPTRRAYDIDNRVKALLDALQHAGCFPDDEAIDELQVARGPIIKGGAAKVVILAHTQQHPEQGALV